MTRIEMATYGNSGKGDVIRASTNAHYLREAEAALRRLLADRPYLSPSAERNARLAAAGVDHALANGAPRELLAVSELLAAVRDRMAQGCTWTLNILIDDALADLRPIRRAVERSVRAAMPRSPLARLFDLLLGRVPAVA